MPVELRPYQREAVKTILTNLREHSVAFQAPTGSGKTLIALEVAKELGSSSVFTRTLSEYMPWERDCRKLDMTFGGLAGKERFCLKPQVKLDSSVVRVTQCRSCPFFTTSYSKKQLQQNGIVKYLEKLNSRGKCGYSWLKREDAEVYIYTYPYYFFYKGLVKGRSLHVFDEAHNLMHAHDLMGITISVARIQRLRKEYTGTDVESSVLPALDALESWVTEGAKSGELPPDLSEYGLEEVEDHTLASLSRALEKVGDPSYRLYVTDQGISIKLLDPAELLSKLNDDRWLMLSGTLPSKAYMEKAWGLKDFRLVAVNPYEFKLSFFWDRDLTTRYGQRTAYREEYVRKVSELRSQQGITLVLVPSYEVASWFKGVADYVEDKSSSVSSVPESGLVVVVARGKLSEGVEFVKEGRSLVKRVVIVGIPYPNTSDQYEKDELDYLMSKVGKRTAWSLLKEEASVIMRQAIGRAVRSQEDSAEVYLLDKRAGPFFKDMGVPLKEVRLI